MALLTTNEAKISLLETLRNSGWAGNTLQAGLFKNNHVPDIDDTFLDLVEADYDGYARLTLTAWSLSVIFANRAVTSAARLVFICTGAVTPNDIYGWFVWDTVNALLLFEERFTSAPIAMDAAGKSIAIDPIISLTGEA